MFTHKVIKVCEVVNTVKQKLCVAVITEEQMQRIVSQSRSHGEVSILLRQFMKSTFLVFEWTRKD